ncbi:2Fe-2S iron-sulfur cluster-binding protein [Crocinitomicaceae bacterium]|nr:2Fe-2S iron-sulfur cluster-binding protein [Crocinitomicaceae bacterium]MDB3905931.1 2Fe-2S iron-sulfur cluster-binding protein [Crocinitomicaceae bacterium]
MGLFKSLRGKSNKAPRGFNLTTIKAVERLSNDTVKVIFNASFDFTPGQYINVSIPINGKEERRSYSICSGKNESVAIAIKEVDKGTVSKWFNQEAKAEMEIAISNPEGNFTKPSDAKNIVAIAAGSGITPIMSISKQVESEGGTMRLYFGNRTAEDIIFRSEIDALEKTSPVYFLSREEQDDCENGRITKQVLIDEFKKDLSLLRADGFFLCGPEEMIVGATEALDMFGVAKDKIHFELFTTPVLMKPEETPESDFKGKSTVTAIVDGEEETFELDSSKTLLTGALDEGVDAPYSCRGGVCSTCKAKVTEGSASMKLNYSLTDQEVSDGFVLTCQAHPTSEKLTFNFDEA